MDNPAFKSKYQKYKYKVKLWEKQFKEKNGRVPSKHDIREAPTSIRESYKMYYKLKTSFLEETLSDALEDDSFDLSLLERSNSQTDLRLSSSFSDITTPDVSALTSESSIINTNCSSGSLSLENAMNAEETVSPLQNKFGTDFEAEATISINQSAWGKGLNTKLTSNGIFEHTGNKLRKSMSDKLFRNASFSKRNPRKSLSRNSFASSEPSQSQAQNSQNDSLPDLETLLSQKVQQLNEKEVIEPPERTTISSNVKGGGVTLASTLDQEWLNRCNAANNIDSELNIIVIPNGSDKSVENSQKFGISNINSNALANYEATAISKSMLSFDMSHLNLQTTKTKDSEPTKIGCNDDEIANSEDEMDQEARPLICSIRSQQQNKRKHDEIDKPMTETKAMSANNNERTNNITSDEKSKSNSKPTRISVIKKKISAKPAVSKNAKEPPIATRRSTRSKTKPMTIKEMGTNKVISYSDNDEEEDPYAGNDSDKDPDFSESEINGKNSQKIQDSTDDDSAEERRKSPKETIRKRVVKAIVKRKSTMNSNNKPRNKRTTKNRSHDSSEEEPIPQDTPDDYVMEFGMETIKSVPRIAIDELKQNTAEFSRYICSDGTGDKSSAKSNISGGVRPMPLSTKNSMAKEKLEMKIASGNLNENFVRLNLRKKVFVRGKKTFNFSRHKKKLWRDKKVAALSGPDMDMGGCDGGILTCFQCGLPGHFAQNCKVRSDRLLPPMADIDESPFPTLQEAEEMSKQKLLLSHTSRDIPHAANPIWKSSEDAMESVVGVEPVDNSHKASSDLLVAPLVSDNISIPAEKPAYIGHKIPEEFLKKAGLHDNDLENTNNIQPLYSLKSDGGIPDTPDDVFEALAMFGHSSFRKGQEKAVMRILSGQSTLVTLSTGSGKSLCYQLPAYLYSRRKKCITLVISPLVSLMEDQVHGVPHFLNAQCLHTNLSEQKRLATIEAIKAGEVDVLLVSPEAIVASEKSTGFGSILRDLPPIAFVCIDEAHCVSQFGHNFRPSYLMVCRVLYEKLKVKTVLGLTATATLSTRQDIVEHLRIPDGLDGVISDIPLPNNLTLTVSCDQNRDLALIELLKEPRFTEFQSIIIYCSRRDQCERVAKNLRTYFQDNIARELELKNTSGKRKRTLKTTIEPYHAGLTASRRRTIQNAFMRGDLKIVVATIAFGMGINKADIRSVIHYNMPMNFESYVQEVGRAGRDGLPSFCHLFLDSKNEDKVELRRHIYANSIDRFTIRKLLHKIFIPCACKKLNDSPTTTTTTMTTVESDLEAVQKLDWDDEFDAKKVPTKRTCPRHEVGFSVDETISELDLPEENIATLLCYLELHDQRYIKSLSKAYISCKVFSYGGPSALKKAAQKCPPLAVAIALDMQKGISHESSTNIEFPVIEIASAIGWNSGVVKYQLKQLEWNNEHGLPKRSKISVEFFNLGFRVLAPGDLTATELDSTLNLLYTRVKEQENKQLAQLENVFSGLSSVTVKSSIIAAGVESNYKKSENLKEHIRNYFQSNDQAKTFENVPEMTSDPAVDSLIISDIRTMIAWYPENNFTGRSLARIFHGVQSPVFPAVIWGRCKHWRAHIKTDFDHIVNLANAEILKLRT